MHQVCRFKLSISMSLRTAPNRKVLESGRWTFGFRNFLLCQWQKASWPGLRWGTAPRPRFFSEKSLWRVDGVPKHSRARCVWCWTEGRQECFDLCQCLHHLQTSIHSGIKVHFTFFKKNFWKVHCFLINILYFPLLIHPPVSPAWKKYGSVTPRSAGRESASLKYQRVLPLSSLPT